MAAIANPPGIPAANEATEDWLVRFNISLFEIAANFSLDTFASTGPKSKTSSVAKVSARNLSRLTFTPGIYTAEVIIFSNATSFPALFCSVIVNIVKLILYVIKLQYY
ncbi:hypothetical protein [Lachnospira hominis (ex Hitch et al. 2024)]|uniref:Uncharacterized protein n=1 Tax=Lachnospira intestinalis TaxID=3133158 RepID=A0ABV1GLS0_9FIRM